MNYFQIQDSHIFGNKLTLMFIQVETKLPFITDWNTELDRILQAYHSPTKAQVIFNTFFFSGRSHLAIPVMVNYPQSQATPS